MVEEHVGRARTGPVLHFSLTLLQLQVTEETAQALQSLGYTCYSRGIIKVKGKGQLCTYFLNTDLTRVGPSSATLG